jgi:hypothetical protein
MPVFVQKLGPTHLLHFVLCGFLCQRLCFCFVDLAILTQNCFAKVVVVVVMA